MENEIWKPVVGYEGLYEVSSFGRIKSIYYNKEKILIPNKHFPSKKYTSLCINLWKEKKSKQLILSRIVAKAFITNPENKPCVNHIDNNPLNNHVSNLEWVTYKENTQHALKNNRLNKLDLEKINNIKKLIKENISYTKIASIYKCTPQNISYINKKYKLST